MEIGATITFPTTIFFSFDFEACNLKIRKCIKVLVVPQTWREWDGGKGRGWRIGGGKCACYHERGRRRRWCLDFFFF